MTLGMAGGLSVYALKGLFIAPKALNTQDHLVSPFIMSLLVTDIFSDHFFIQSNR